MKRWCFHLLAAAALLILLAAALLWPRSHTQWECLTFLTPQGQLYLQTTRPGFVDIAYYPTPTALRVTFNNGQSWFPEGSNTFDNPRHKFAGVGIYWPQSGSTDFSFIRLPFWLIITLSAPLPAWWLITWRKRRNLRLPGHCPRCGYDLRASKDRCPECGTPMPAQSPNPAIS